MKISFDLDGVLYPWHQIVWDSFFRKDYPDYIQFWKNGWLHISTEKWNELLPDPSLYQHPARADVVRMVHDIGMTKFVYYISSRPASLAKITQRWLVINGFLCPGDIYLAEDKVEVCKKLKIDLHVEDRLDVMHNLADNDIRVLGIKQPWNEDGIDDFPHVDHILEAEREIARIEATMKVHRRRNGNE